MRSSANQLLPPNLHFSHALDLPGMIDRQHLLISSAELKASETGDVSPTVSALLEHGSGKERKQCDSVPQKEEREKAACRSP